MTTLKLKRKLIIISIFAILILIAATFIARVLYNNHKQAQVYKISDNIETSDVLIS